MADQTYRQAPLRQAYLGYSWTRVPRRSRRDVRRLVACADALLSNAGIATFIGRRDNAAGSASERLFRSRAAMRRSELYLLILHAPSDGGSEELRSAESARTPVLYLRRNGVPRPRISDWPSLRLLDDLAYDTCDSAVAMLDAYLKVHRERLAEEARHLAFTRSQLARATDIGAAVRREREARGMSQEAVARRAGLSRAAIAMLERSGSVFNPPIDHVQAIAQALGTDLAALTLPKDEWLARRADQIYSQIAEELNWSVPLLRRFSQARWTEIRFRDEQPSADAMRAEMIWFQREWERNE